MPSAPAARTRPPAQPSHDGPTPVRERQRSEAALEVLVGVEARERPLPPGQLDRLRVGGVADDLEEPADQLQRQLRAVGDAGPDQQLGQAHEDHVGLLQRRGLPDLEVGARRLGELVDDRVELAPDEAVELGDLAVGVAVARQGVADPVSDLPSSEDA